VLERPLKDERVFHASSWRPDRYVSIESSATSAVNLEWFVREIAGTHDAAVFESCNAMVASVMPDPDLPLFQPFLYGSATQPDARGAFLGLAGWHGKPELLYALYEGVVFEHRRHIDKLRAAGATFNRASLSGGGARSAVWCQMFADIIGVPVTVAACRETGALGAAVIAGVAGGLFATIEDGMAQMVRTTNRYEPGRGAGTVTNARYRLHCELAEAMPARWQRYRREAGT
jgi:L-xylulokinase